MNVNCYRIGFSLEIISKTGFDWQVGLKSSLSDQFAVYRKCVCITLMASISLADGSFVLLPRLCSVMNGPLQYGPRAELIL